MSRLGDIRDCCSYGGVGCCDLLVQMENNGYGANGLASGLGAADPELTKQVQDTLDIMPQASGTVASPSKVGFLYDVLTGATEEGLRKSFDKYKEKVAYMNETLRKIDARRDDLQLRQTLLAEHARVAKKLGEYGKALVDQINRYNDMIKDFSGTVAGRVTMPDTIPVTGLPRLDVPTLSGFGDLGLAWAPVALVAVIALIIYLFSDLIESYMIYDLKLKGIESGLDQDYRGFMGTIKKYIDKAGGSVLTTALLVGGGVVAFFFLKNYMTRKGMIGASAAKAAVKEIEAVAPKPVPAPTPPSEPTVKSAVKELEAVAKKA